MTELDTKPETRAFRGPPHPALPPRTVWSAPRGAVMDVGEEEEGRGEPRELREPEVIADDKGRLNT